MTKPDCRSSSLVSGLACCCAGVLAFSSAALAEPQRKSTILVELFTSQNCPACPSANEKLIELAENNDIFPLTYSVSYWDYLGWEDTFAKQEFNERQSAYRQAFGLRSRYTPQTVVDGCIQTSGRKPSQEVVQQIAHARTPHGYAVNLKVGAFSADLSASDAIPEAEIWLVGFQPGITSVMPGDGKNKNRLLNHINMVTSVDSVGHWDGEKPSHFDLKCPAEACAVIVQEAVSKDIMAFAEMPGDALTDMRAVNR